MKDHHRPTTPRLKRAEPAGAWGPAKSRRRRLASVREGPCEPRRSEEREGEPPLPLPHADSSEKTSAPPEPGEIVSSSASSSSSSSSPLEPPCPSARSDEDSVDVVKEKLDVVADGRQQAESSETEASTCNADFSRGTTTPSEATAKSPTMKPSQEKPTAAAEMPSGAELESFFSAAEKREQRRFAERYNYDVVTDVPLEGRYEWIRLKP